MKKKSSPDSLDASPRSKRSTRQLSSDTQYVACNDCALDQICQPIPLGAGKPFSYILDNMQRRSPLFSGDFLYHEGETLNSIYAVTSGCLKLTKTMKSGEQQVVGFRFPGELLGDEALLERVQVYSAQAIEDTSVCKILLTDIEGISQNVPSFQNSFISLITKQCHLIHRQFGAYVARNSAEAKVAAFLLNTSERAGIKSNLSTKLFLPMSRSDIASFLGIRHETLSRTLSKFQSLNMIQVQGKFIYISDVNALQATIEE